MATFSERLGRLMGGRATTGARAVATRQRKSAPFMAAIIETAQPTARWTQMDYTAMSREGYGGNPYVYKAIDLNARAFAGIKWRLYTNPTKKKELTDHPLLDIWRRPNPRQGGTKWRAMFMAYLLIDGNSFIQALAPAGKGPTELYCLRPDRVQVIPGSVTNPIAGYTYTVNQAKVRLPAETVRHEMLFNPVDDWRGLSPMSPAAKSIDQSNAARGWNMALYQNGARPSGVITTQYTLEDEQYIRLKEEIADEYAGFVNAGRPVLLEGGATWQETGMSPSDMHWEQGQKLAAREVALCFNIAPELIGDSENKTYSNYQEARRALYEENILPTCDIFREDICDWLCLQYDPKGDLYMDYDIKDIEAMQENMNDIEGRATRQFVAGYITVNEARVDVGKPEDTESEWGDSYVFELPMRTAGGPEPEPAKDADPNTPLLPGPDGMLKPPAQPGLPPAGGTGGDSPQPPSGPVQPPTPPNAPDKTGGADAAKKRRVLPFSPRTSDARRVVS